MPVAVISSPSDSVQRVIDALAALGHAERPVMLDAAARTAQQAADALGVALGQIAKSIVFRHVDSERAVLVVCAGDRRVDEHAVAARVGRLSRADADFVRAATGFAIGGVSPVGHTQPPIALVDDSLWRFDRIWAAAGHPHAVFALRPDDLPRWLGATPSAVTQPPR
ncbi:MAG: YbaK/EbsC family protein [Thiomonas sp.]|uniref:YbaK/EbsC family protein n=1 Tax=Thiomonas sp. TaxID=2047785 RepID=UPI002A369C6C|nr:YbaK/EbsC family protein [Thiomonas sp.]MDY0329329.1 YbaK/EbsC family protein [Thiomonas sp.]